MSEIVPHPQLGVPNIQGVQSEGHVGVVVEEPTEAVALSVAKFQGPQIFVHASQYEWHPTVHVQGLDEEECQWIVVMEGLLHRFGVKTEA